MDQYLAGQAVTLSTGTIQMLVGGVLTATNPATLTLTITQPDTTTVTKVITDFTHDGTGQYHYDFLPTQTGAHAWRIVATGPNTAAEGLFNVAAAGAGAPVVDLQDFKNYLNLTSNTGPGGDAELQGFLDAALGLISYRIGGITLTPGIVETAHGGGAYVTTKQPIVSVSSVVEWIGSTPYTLTQQSYAGSGPFGQWSYSIDGPKTLTRRTMGFDSRFVRGHYNIVITYTGGFATCPPVVVLAIKELGKHLFKTQSGSRGGNQPVDWAAPSFALPRRVIELIAPWDDTGAGMFA